MTIQLSTDKKVSGNQRFTAHHIAQIESELSRYTYQIMGIEVRLSDEDGRKYGLNEIGCVIEARLEGRQSIAVTNQADTYELAVSGAIDKLTTSLDTSSGQLSSY